MTDYLPGQRWRSEAEPELGLGLVQAREGRRVTIHFPASDETRIYAAESAPLLRVTFNPGDQILVDGEVQTIDAAETQDGIFHYQTASGLYPEAVVEAVRGSSNVADRLASGQIDPNPAFELRVTAQRLRRDIRANPVRGFIGAKVGLLPHQIHIASEVATRPRPRVLLADEVGLGKTIEACLILHRLHRTGRAERILILVPEALINQWFVELYRRFHLTFSIPDAVDTDFEARQLVITSTERLLNEPTAAAAAVNSHWDLVIVDEAHHLAWSEDAPSPAYRLVEALGQKSPGLLLLTATPEQLGRASHYARLRLLDPERYPSLDAFEAEADRYEATVKQAEALHKKGDTKALRSLLDEAGPGRAMFRNTRSAIAGFPERRVHPVTVEDKADWLAEHLRANREKHLLICKDSTQIDQLAEQLRDRINVKTALFTEHLTLLQRDRNAAWFAEEDGARLLLCSEIGGEGRNFQFCQHLILYDLPAHPERLEQRIGRLDRIGQQDVIHIHVPTVAGSEEARRFAWFHEGMDAFAAPLRGAGPIMKAFGERFAEGEPLTSLNPDTRAARDKIEATLEAGRDRLLELHSCDPERAADWIQRIQTAETDAAFASFLLRMFDAGGVIAEDLGRGDWLLQPGPTYRGDVPGMPESGEPLAITTSRTRALEREELTFLTTDHPMATEGIDQLLTTGFGAVAAVKVAGNPDVHLEVLFMLECPAPARLHLDRFLPPTPLHLVVDPSGALVEPDGMEIVDPHLRHPLQDHPPLSALVPQMLEAARDHAEAAAESLLEVARKTAAESLGVEIERIAALAKNNPDVRPEDVEALKQDAAEIINALSSPAVRLDALRLLLFSP